MATWTSTVTRQITRAMRNRKTVKLTAAHSDEGLHGFPVSFNADFIILHRMYEWQFDGWVLVPMGNVGELRSGKFERAAERILEAEGLARQVRLPPRIRVDSYQSIFADLAKIGRFSQIERLEDASDANEKTFLIGPVVAVDEERVRIHNFDALGKWDRRATSVRLGQLALVEIGTRYAAVWKRHLPPRPQQ